MTPKERIVAGIRGQEVDRLPWCPFFTYWWDAQPEQRQKEGQPAFYREIGADALLRGPTTAFTSTDLLGMAEVPLGASYNLKDDLPAGTISRRTDGGQHKYVSWETPVGKLEVTLTYSPQGGTWFVTRHPVRRKEDYRTLQWLVEHMRILPYFSEVHAQIDELGEDGLVAPLVSPFLKSPFQSLLEHFVGTEKLCYDLADFPETVEETLAVMGRKAREAVRISAQSRAEAFITWEDSSTTNLSPEMFRKYVAPELDAWGRILHSAGKMLIHHACGHVRALLPIIAGEQIDAVESVSPPPTGNIEIWDAQVILEDRVGLIGGIEPVKLQTFQGKRFESYIREILEKTAGRHFILANSDSCPPAVTEENFRTVGRLVREHPVR
jgi:uroporphyrinogen-III decarboxylase